MDNMQHTYIYILFFLFMWIPATKNIKDRKFENFSWLDSCSCCSYPEEGDAGLNAKLPIHNYWEMSNSFKMDVSQWFIKTRSLPG